MLSTRLELNHEKGQPDLYCPAVSCDFCGLPIDNARDGNYHWQAPGSPLCFTHKRCAADFERRNANGVRWLSDELRLLPVRIATNLGIELRP